MKSYNPAELLKVAEDLNGFLQGAQLQEVHLGPKGPILYFWRQGVQSLYIDLTPVNPLVFFFEGKAKMPKQKATKPVLLFLKSHGVNKLFERALVDPKKGRVLDLKLSGESDVCQLEIRLFPHGQNLIVKAGAKEVSWLKPKELPQSEVDFSQYAVEQSLEGQSQQYLSKKVASQGTKNDKASQLTQAVKRTQKNLKKLNLELEKRQSLQWEKAGKTLLVQQSLEGDNDELEDYIDAGHNLAWNIENCFAKAKDNRKKLKNLEDRIEVLKAELERLEQGEVSGLPNTKSSEPSSGSRLMQKSGAKGRKMNLGDGAEAIIGKSAKDNLSLLRRAQAWDLWLHLRDYPGAHAIVRRNKKRELEDNEIREITGWLVQESLGKAKLQGGEVYSVVMAECRFVRPIKGDKLGRVTFQNERNFQFKI